MLGVERFMVRKPSGRTPPHALDQVADFMTNNGLTHVFVGQPVLLKKMVIEKMTKGAMPYVVEQCGDPE